MFEKCFCDSGEDYLHCCHPFHEGTQIPKTSLELMRSRYCAYAKGLAQYIIATTHPKNPAFEHDSLNWMLSIQSFCFSTKFIRLEILNYQDQGNRGEVLFLAHLSQKGRDVSFQEKSLFVKEGGRWLYLEGEVSSKK